MHYYYFDFHLSVVSKGGVSRSIASVSKENGKSQPQRALTDSWLLYKMSASCSACADQPKALQNTDVGLFLHAGNRDMTPSAI